MMRRKLPATLHPFLALALALPAGLPAQTLGGRFLDAAIDSVVADHLASGRVAGVTGHGGAEQAQMRRHLLEVQPAYCLGRDRVKHLLVAAHLHRIAVCRQFIKTGGGASPVAGQFYLDDIYLEDTDTLNLNSPGDSNGDGLSDADAVALGLDPTDPDGDTDNDGQTDVIEIGGDVNNPLDSDVDGVIDALEAGTTAIDPAVATGPFVTTAIDIISVYLYFVLATSLVAI